MYALPDVKVIKSWRMIWAGHAACMGELRNLCTVSVRNLKGRDYLEDLGMCERIILEWSVGK